MENIRVVNEDGVAQHIELPKPEEPGYYEVAVYTYAEGEKKYLDRTSVAVLENSVITATEENTLFGINTHISQGYRNNSVRLISDEIKKLGVKSIRDGYYWAQMSTEEGVTNSPDTTVMEAAKANGIGMYVVGGFSNSVYLEDGEIAPESEKAINGFAEYVAKIYETYSNEGAHLDTIELWNEYWEWYEDDSESPVKYANMFNGVYDRLIEEYPNINLSIGFVGSDGYNFWDETVLSQSGISDKLGIATVHKYSGIDRASSQNIMPEQTFSAYNQLAKTRAMFDENGCSDTQLWLTETGYSSLPNDVNGNKIVVADNNPDIHSNRFCVTEKEAAMYLPRLIVMALSEGADRVYPYQLVDIDRGISTHDSFYGFLRHENTVCGLYSPKPQYVSYGVLIRQLDGMEFSSKSQIGSVYRYEFTNGTDNVSVIYSCQGIVDYEYETDTAVEVTDIMGRNEVLYPTDGAVTITLDGNVKYIRKI